MKRCPQCNRTYSDDTFSFCLADGSLLSAPYQPDDTLVLPSTSSSHTQPTEVTRQNLISNKEKVFEFIGDDEGYVQWLKNNSTGFVINTKKSKTPKYMVLHRAKCPHISVLGDEYKGGWTERAYIKICSLAVESLREWVKHNGRADGSFSKMCLTCKPKKSIE